eukprot:TRINITY_DN8925_c0_g1_i2.p2 TRINITY_DN8925_c0_g1~~TRINITY_DN8925_c0_g1_i2.p2  ORF type:complete len:133 (-),score=42.06 TRINITY_DN8925_c0_g1_i2:268-666(-)
MLQRQAMLEEAKSTKAAWEEYTNLRREQQELQTKVAALQAMVDVVCQTDEYVVNDGKHTREYAEKLELELIEARLNIAQLRCEYDLLMSTKRTKRGRVGGRPVRAKKPTAWSKLNHVIRFAGAAKPKKPTTS